MFGGLGVGKFFSSQVHSFVVGLVDELPSERYSDEEEAAGFPEIGRVFGFYATMDAVARYVIEADKSVLKWNVREFYTKLKYMAWMKHAVKEHQRLLAEKNKAST